MKDVRPDIREFEAGDGVRLLYRQWNAIRPRAIVLCLHGIRSHGAWYADSCRFLSRRGYRVIFPDRRGSGLNSGRGEEKIGLHQWISDTKRIMGAASRELPGVPVHIMGISWGGRLAVAVAAAGDVEIRSLILSTPGLVSIVDYSLWRKAAVLLALALAPRRLFPVPLSDPAMFTDDPDERNYIEMDELGLRRAPARFFAESRKLERLARARCRRVRQPSLLMLAGRDGIIDNEKVKQLFGRFRSTEKVVKVYPEARHTLEFDSCRGRYFGDILAWLNGHSPKEQ